MSYTLLADGSSDRTLQPLINWLLEQSHPDIQIRPQFAHRIQGHDLLDRALQAIKLFPCDVLFVHRDAEKLPFEDRVKEIEVALTPSRVNYVPVVPVRMTEAWLLSNEAAIRQAAGNPMGNMALNLPPAKKWEKLADPKNTLFEALRTASGLTGRRLRQFNPEEARHRVAEIPTDFTKLLASPAFASLQMNIQQLVVRLTDS
ncbi:hypothetical protein [Hydrogenophaga soli]